MREAAYEIIAGKGYTSFGVATAIVRICEAMVRDERSVLPVSTLLTGQFGIENLYLSLPCVLGTAGVHRVLLPDLADGEVAALRASAVVLEKALATFEQEPAASSAMEKPDDGAAGEPGGIQSEPASALPGGLSAYKRTPEFTEHTVPKGLLHAHSTKAGVWGRICVTSGELEYRVVDPARRPRELRLSRGTDGIVEPGICMRCSHTAP